MGAFEKIHIEATVKTDAAAAWRAYLEPESVMAWNAASPDWHCPAARNDPRPGGSFSYRMEARDGSAGFDFSGTFLELDAPKRLRYVLGDGREVVVSFELAPGGTKVSLVFDAETLNSTELQRQGWQAILDRYAEYAGRQASR